MDIMASISTCRQRQRMDGAVMSHSEGIFSLELVMVSDVVLRQRPYRKLASPLNWAFC